MRGTPIGQSIKELRKKRGMTGEQLGLEVGVSTAAVSKWENNIAYPDITLIPLIASVFEVSIDYLFGYSMGQEAEQMDKVRMHFEEEAKEFDDIIKRIIPYYEEMIEAMIAVLPFGEKDEIKVIDLGAGTGTIAKAVKDKFPNAKITCLDFSANMLEMAKSKLKGYIGIDYVEADFYTYVFKEKYDLVISSLALHHLVTNEDKKNFYKVIYDALEKEGVFYNLDVVLASSESVQNVYINQWKTFMYKCCSEEEVEQMWLRKYKE
ncbi:MAG: methyltransferase domain-containing protein, partial [Cellulosilyticaceae bacterium]